MASKEDASRPSSPPPRKTPILAPTPDSKPEPRPELTPDQQAKYDALLTKARSWNEVVVAVVGGSSDGKKQQDQEEMPGSGTGTGPMTDGERAWLTRECLLRYLRATRWSVDEAARRVLATLAWRRETGFAGGDEDDGDNSNKTNDRKNTAAATAAYIEPEQTTGKQVIIGYDRAARPCHYLLPGRQNTGSSPRQVRHLFYMIERVVDLMPAGVEQLCLMIDFSGRGGNKQNTSVPVSVAREVLHVLQNHYPERLGKALIINVPWIVWGFFKIITPFIDPVTRNKLKFNEDMTQYVPSEQLWGPNWPGGTMRVVYQHDVYWGALNELCARRRRRRMARWRAAGGVVGESEDYLGGGIDTSVMGFRYIVDDETRRADELAEEACLAEELYDKIALAEKKPEAAGQDGNMCSDIVT